MEKLYSLNLNINQLPNSLEYNIIIEVADKLINVTFMEHPRNAFIYDRNVLPLTSQNWSYFNNNLYAMMLDENNQIIFKDLTN